MRYLLERELKLKRDKVKKDFCITYNVAKCGRDFYGVYVKSLSGMAIYGLYFKFPEVNVDINENSATYGRITLDGKDFKGALKVNSNRLARFKSEQQAREYIKRLQALTFEQQITKLAKYRFWIVDKDNVLLKLQYYQFRRDILGTEYKLFTSQNKSLVEKLAIEYTMDGVKNRITPTVSRTKKVNKDLKEDVLSMAESKPYTPTGLTGMTKSIKDQSGEFLRRVSQKRKRTTQVSFFNKYR